MGCGSSTDQAKSVETAKRLAKEVNTLTKTGDLDIRTVTMTMWKARNLPELVSALSDLVSTHSDEKNVFDGIEFYLPQLIHMILHLEVNWPSSALEQFALMISQQSIHFALQMNWILVAAMEDYQPEDEEGKKNPRANPELYLRCAKLQHNLERSVVFGSPRCSEYERLYQEGRISKDELQELELQDRKFAAKEFVEEGKGRKYALEGALLYKRTTRTSRFAPKGWKQRRFAVQDRVLFCFRDDNNSTLKRAIPLQHTEVHVVENPKYQW